MELLKAYDAYKKKTLFELSQGKIFTELKNTEDGAFIPTKKYPSDAGYDCRARIDESITLQPGNRVKIPLGFGINIPWNHTGDLRPRSGLTADYGIMVGYGTIDPGFTGEVKATIFNFGDEPFIINPKDRIAQLVILPTARAVFDKEVKLSKVSKLLDLERNENGHGSTGVK